MYELIFDKQAIAQLSKLEEKFKRRMFNKIVSTKENPHHSFKRLSGRTDYTLRVGDYRIIADIDDHNKKIKITLIGHGHVEIL